MVLMVFIVGARFRRQVLLEFSGVFLFILIVKKDRIKKVKYQWLRLFLEVNFFLIKRFKGSSR